MSQLNIFKIKLFSFFTQKDIFEKISLVVLCYAFFYNCVKAYSASIYFDEVTTFQISSQSFIDILTFREASAANHLFNTLWMKISVNLFGLSEFMLRLPSVIGHGVYLITVFKLLKLFTKKTVLLFSLCFFVFNPFLLDLFSVARGYGLALAFLVLGIYSFFQGIKQSPVPAQMAYFNRAAWFLSLSVVAHLIFIYPFVSFLMLICIYKAVTYLQLRKPERSFGLAVRDFVNDISSLVLAALFVAFVYAGPVIRMMSRKDHNFWGAGTKGFWESTVGSLIRVTLYGSNYGPGDIFFIIKGLVFVLFWGAVVFILYKYFTKQRFSLENKYLLGMSSWLLLCVILIQLNWLILNVGFVVNRLGSFYFPLFFCLVALLWQHAVFVKKRIVRIAVNGLFILLTIGYVLNFLNHANFALIYHVPYDASTKQAMRYLDALNTDSNLKDQSMSLGTYWLLRPSTNFYREKYQLSWLKPITSRGHENLLNKYQYYLLFDDRSYLKEELYQFQQHVIQTHNLEFIKRFPAYKSPTLVIAVPRVKESENVSAENR